MALLIRVASYLINPISLSSCVAGATSHGVRSTFSDVAGVARQELIGRVCLNWWFVLLARADKLSGLVINKIRNIQAFNS